MPGPLRTIIRVVAGVIAVSCAADAVWVSTKSPMAALWPAVFAIVLGFVAFKGVGLSKAS